jgi:hypothetical protein
MVPLPALLFGTLGIAMASGSAANSITSSTGASIGRWRAHDGDLWRRGVCGRVRPSPSRVPWVWAQ